MFLSFSQCIFRLGNSVLLGAVLFAFPPQKQTFGKRVFSYTGPTQWNALPYDLRHSQSISSFKTQFNTHLFHICIQLTSFCCSCNSPPSWLSCDTCCVARTIECMCVETLKLCVYMCVCVHVRANAWVCDICYSLMKLFDVCKPLGGGAEGVILSFLYNCVSFYFLVAYIIYTHTHTQMCSLYFNVLS